MPVVNGTFAYSSLVDTIKTVSAQSGIKLPTNFKLVDIRYFMFVISLYKPLTIKTDNNFIKCLLLDVSYSTVCSMEEEQLLFSL